MRFTWEICTHPRRYTLSFACRHPPTDTQTRGGTHLDRTVEKNDSSLFTRKDGWRRKEGGRGEERKRGEERNADHHVKTREKWSPRGTE